MKTFDLNLLRVLDAVLGAGSVSGAAQRLHLSVPATSHALARLRELVGDPLLVRAGRRMVPTPRALALREPVRGWIAEAQALVGGHGLLDLASVRRSFVIRAPEGMAIGFGAALAVALRERMPLATLRFAPESLDDPDALREGRVDLDIGAFRPREPEVVCIDLGGQRQVAVVRRGHALTRRTLGAQRYAEAAHVDVQRRAGTVSTVDDALAALGLQRQVVLTVPQAHVSAIIAGRSDLVATISERVAASMAPSLDLQVLPLAFVDTPQPLTLAWHPRHAADPAHAWLRDRFLQLLNEAGRSGSPPSGGTRRERPP